MVILCKHVENREKTIFLVCSTTAMISLSIIYQTKLIKIK